MLNFHVSPVAGRHFMKTRIFFVDDDEQIRKLMKRFLELNGYEVFVFGTGNVCEINEERKCAIGENGMCADIIISDLHMPYISGVEFVEKLISSQCKCPNIALASGAWSSEKIQKAQARAARLYPTRRATAQWLPPRCALHLCRSSPLPWASLSDGHPGTRT